VTARAATLNGRLGAPLSFGSLTITLRSCVVRPSEQAPDAAAYLDVIDSRPGVAPFHGWLLLSAPAASVYEHPVYDVRLAACRG
jgi:hypothetical protein